MSGAPAANAAFSKGDLVLIEAQNGVTLVSTAVPFGGTLLKIYSRNFINCTRLRNITLKVGCVQNIKIRL